MRLNQTYVAEWTGSYTFLGTTYDTEYYLYLDLEEVPSGTEGRSGTLRLSEAVDDFGRPTSLLGVTWLGASFWRVDPERFSGSKQAPDQDEAELSFSGGLVFSASNPISTLTFEGVQTLSDSLIVGTLTCTPSLYGCESATVTLRPYSE